MGLFINHDSHPDVFKNRLEIKEPNQEFYKQDYLSEVIEKQKQANDLLSDSFQKLEHAYRKQSRIQSRRLVSVRYNLEMLKDKQIKQKEVENNVVESLERYEDKNGELILKIDQQTELQQKMLTQIVDQENLQLEVVSRLENQEALAEKILRKIDDFRSIIYERTNYLAEKIEKGYTSTSSYIHKLITTTEDSDIQHDIKVKQKSVD